MGRCPSPGNQCPGGSGMSVNGFSSARSSCRGQEEGGGAEEEAVLTQCRAVPVPGTASRQVRSSSRDEEDGRILSHFLYDTD